MADVFPESAAEGWDTRRSGGRHHPHARHRRGTEGQFGSSGDAAGSGPHGARAVDPAPQVRPGRSGLARPRPVRPERRSRLDAALCAASSGRLRPCGRGTRGFPAVGQSHAGSSGAWAHPRGGDDHGASGGRLLQRRGHGHRRSVPRRHLQPARLRPGGPPHLRHRQRRRPHGRGGLGGRLAGRSPWPGQAGLSLRRQPDLHRGLHANWPSPRTWAPASRPTAGRCSRWTTATTWRPSTRPSPPPGPRRAKPSLVMVRTVIGCGSPHKAGTAEAHGSPLGAGGDQADQGGSRLAGRPVLRRARAGARAVRGGRSRRSGRAGPLGRDVRPLRAGVPRACRAVAGSAMAGQAAGGVDGRDCRSSPRARAWPPGRPPARSSTPWRRCVPTLIGGSADLAPSNNTYLSGLRRPRARVARRAQPALRGARARDGRHPERPGRSRRVVPLRRAPS